MKPTFLGLVLISLVLALPASGKTYKSMYANPCSEVWSAVKDALAVPENYQVVESDDNKMTVAYHVKHTVHVNVTGAILQRTNHVSLISNGPACEMRVISNFSGWEHNDREDFKKRVDESLVKLKAAKPAEPAKSETPTE